MNLEYLLPFRRGRQPTILHVKPVSEQRARPPHAARMLALAHKLEGLLRTGVVKDYATLAHLGHLSVSRVSQIMLLLYLAPAIQERVLFLNATEARVITEEALRAIAREARWDRQIKHFDSLFSD